MLGITYLVPSAPSLGSARAASSCPFFLLCHRLVMHYCQGDFRTTVCDAIFTDLDYADGAVLLTERPSQWPVLLQGFEKRQGTRVCIQSVQNVCNISPLIPTGQVIEAVEKFTYLGYNVDLSGYSLSYIHRRIGLTASTMGQLDCVWLRNRDDH